MIAGKGSVAGQDAPAAADGAVGQAEQGVGEEADAEDGDEDGASRRWSR